MVESWIVCWMNLLLSFVNFCMQEFFESVCVVSQKIKVVSEDNKDRFRQSRCIESDLINISFLDQNSFNDFNFSESYITRCPVCQYNRMEQLPLLIRSELRITPLSMT
jgi:hypothetical protein